jgi:hypothetical protein
MAVSWQWIFAIIGLVAFLMAVQPFTQFMWGRPKIEIEFGARDKDKSRFLDILLLNRPIKSRFLKSIRVRRDKAEDVFLVCEIENCETQQMYAEKMIPKISTVEGESLRVALPGSTTPATITLIGSFDNGETSIADKNKTLVPGKYYLEITVHCAEIIIKKHARFSVGTKPYELCWIVNS